jgi:pimeloyl-ACP methyl ester carboxylesterase
LKPSPTSEPTATLSPTDIPPTAEPSPTPAAERPTFATVDEAYAQHVAWRPCHFASMAALCAFVFVPTDYANPAAGTTAISVARFPATDPKNGVLFTNPGGPGQAGTGFAAYVANSSPILAHAFDIIGFDPRGTGESDPLVCLDTPAFDELNAFDPTPETASERQQGIDLVDQQGAACGANSGALAAHVSTVEAARDMDVIRGVLGKDKLNYFGFSYGTFLGTTYAALFPDKVGRFVLDGALPPGLNNMQASEGQTTGIQTALTAFIEDCVSHSPCTLGDNADAAATELRHILESADQSPLTTDDPARPLTQALAFFGIAQTLYRRDSWPDLTLALEAAKSGDGQPLLALSDAYFDRGPQGYESNYLQANQAINCLDEEIAGGPSAIPEQTFTQDSPLVGDIMFGLADRGCGDWPLKTTVTAPDYLAPGTPPIVVIGTTRDPATPYVWAQELANTLDNGTLLTRDGDGHTAFFSGNQCIRNAVNTFFLVGTVPTVGTTC